MNAEKLLNISTRVIAEFERTQVVSHVNNIVNFLNQVGQNPNPNFIQQLNQELASFSAQMDGAKYEDFGASDKCLLDDLDLIDLVGPGLKELVMENVQKNSITYSLAAQEIAPIGARLTQKSDALNKIISGLSLLGIREYKNEIDAELSVLIPRKYTNESLESLTKEMKSIHFILRPFFEINNASVDEIKVNSLSSSEYLVYLLLAPKIAKDFATVIDKLFDWFERYIKIRQDLQSLKAKDVEQSFLDQIVVKETASLDTLIEEISNQICNQSKIGDSARKNELNNMMKKSIKGIAERFDNGFSFDINLPEKDPTFDTPEEEKSWEETKKIVTTKRYAKLEGNGFLQITHEEVVEEKTTRRKS